MVNRWRHVATTAAVVIGTAGIVSGQTVYLRNAPAGSNVEVVLNAASAGTGVVDSEGEAKVPFTLPADKTEMDANVFVDVCNAAKLRKVIINDRARLPPPPAEGCDRGEIPGIYWVRPVNTIVVDVGGPTPTLLLVRGSYTPPKPSREVLDEEHPSTPAPRPLMFAGGACTGSATPASCSAATRPARRRPPASPTRSASTCGSRASSASKGRTCTRTR
jgi:hypothetical protein